MAFVAIKMGRRQGFSLSALNLSDRSCTALGTVGRKTRRAEFFALPIRGHIGRFLRLTQVGSCRAKAKLFMGQDIGADLIREKFQLSVSNFVWIKGNFARRNDLIRAALSGFAKANRYLAMRFIRMGFEEMS
jgi:hypothetical protein